MIEEVSAQNRIRLSSRSGYLVGTNSPIHLESLSQLEGSEHYTTFRISCAHTDNECRILCIYNSDTHEKLGSFDIRYPVARQSFDATLDRPITAADLQAGLLIKQTTVCPPLEIAAGIHHAIDAPHVLSGATAPNARTCPESQLIDASISEIGWMEGCILEGLFSLASYDTALLKERTREFFALHWDKQRLEGTLPVAALARLSPNDTYIHKVLELWTAHRDADGMYSEGGRVVAESCLTLAYPMAVIAKQRKDRALAEVALAQLQHCSDKLRCESGIALRCFEDVQRVFINWARGVGWYLLGHAKAIRELEGWLDTSSALDSLQSGLEFVKGYQRENGLWGSFIDDSNCLPDTSGSAIIATAAAIFDQLKPNTREYHSIAQSALGGLESYLSPDGLLGGATQHNCGGEELQRGDYRVSHPYTLGLLAELKNTVRNN